MTVLPIVARELRQAARLAGTYWIRFAVGMVAIIISGCIFVLTLGMPVTSIGRHIFEGLAGLVLAYCLAYGRRSTADCLSQEKREGTLGLLFLTDLNGFDIVLGKLAATSLRGFYGLLAIFPVLGVPLLLGGVSQGELWRTILVLVDTFLFSLAIGVLGSALTRDFRRAMAANFLLLLALVVLPAAGAAAIAYFKARTFVPELLYSCPVYAFYLCADIHYTAAKNHFWWSLAVIHALSWLLVVLASLRVPHSWQDVPQRARESRWCEFWHRWNYGDADGQKVFRRQALNENAFYWLAARAWLKPRHVWAFLGCMAAWWLVGFLTSGKLWLDSSVAILTALLLNSTLKVWVAIEAGQRLAEDRKAGAFELLLSSGLTVHEILRGQWLALRSQFLRPLLVVIALNFVFMLTLRQSDPGSLTWLAGILMLIADVITLGWVAMRRAISAKSYNHATIATVLRVLIFPWLIFGMVLGFGQVWYGLMYDRIWSPSLRFSVILWFGIGLGIDLLFGFLSWLQLNTKFREIALQRFTSHKTEANSISVARTASAPPKELAQPESPRAQVTSVAAQPARSARPSRIWAAARKFALVLLCLVIVIIARLLWRSAHPTYPPPVVVSLTQSNASLHVVPGGNGALFLMPDGSLWRWGQAGSFSFGSRRAAMPEQIGTNHDWVQAAAGYNYSVGLRRDRTMWEWGPALRGVAGSAQNETLKQVDSGHDWVSIAAAPVGIRSDGTLWARQDPYAYSLNAGMRAPNLLQAGTNNDWAQVFGYWNGMLALRADGTLWAWGYLLAASTTINLPGPTKICRETNWVGVSMAFRPIVQNSSGEIWELFHNVPSSEASISSSGRLLLSHSSVDCIAIAMCKRPKLYERRSDGSLWEKNYDFQWPSMTPDNWRRVGDRSDWVSICSGSGAAFGVTTDGTLWTWGSDLGRPPVVSLSLRLKTLQMRVRSLFPAGTGVPQPAGMQPINQEPRPLLRMILTNAPTN